jgi:hypothetical protein
MERCRRRQIQSRHGGVRIHGDRIRIVTWSSRPSPTAESVRLTHCAPRIVTERRHAALIRRSMMLATMSETLQVFENRFRCSGIGTNSTGVLDPNSVSFSEPLLQWKSFPQSRNSLDSLGKFRCSENGIF